jgi:protoporphyrinogen oxidase
VFEERRSSTRAAPPCASRDKRRRKWPDHAPSGRELIRCFLSKDSDADDQALAEQALRELRSTLGIEGDPLWSMTRRRDRVLPIFSVGHKDRVARARALASTLGGLTLTGNGFDVMGMGDCLVSGLALAPSTRGASASVTLAQRSTRKARRCSRPEQM